MFKGPWVSIHDHDNNALVQFRNHPDRSPNLASDKNNTSELLTRNVLDELNLLTLEIGVNLPPIIVIFEDGYSTDDVLSNYLSDEEQNIEKLPV